MAAREHSAAAADARAHIAGLGREPLAPLPDGFAEGRTVLHRIAEETLQIKGREQRGAGWLRPFTPGGIGSPAWEVGNRSGQPGSIRIEGAELVTVTGDSEERAPILVDPEATAALADFYALTTVALDELIGISGDADADPIRLWPEHFDAATTLGDEAAGTRANYGGSPGDDDHPEPYLYVGPWSEQPQGGIWNATGFAGAELGYGELLGAGDQLEAAREFFRRHLEVLRSSERG